MRCFYRFQVFLESLFWIHKEPSHIAVWLVVLAVVNVHLGGVKRGVVRLHNDLVGLGTAEAITRRDHAVVFLHLGGYPMGDFVPFISCAS